MSDPDVIIVGSGTAGCALARRLVERTKVSVLLIEAGPPYPRWALNAPLASLRLRWGWSWPTETVPQEQLQGRRIPLPMGRVVGGTSAVNAMIAVAGPAADYDRWPDLGCPGWSWSDLRPAFERAASASDKAMLSISKPAFVSDFSRSFLEACEQSGLRRVESLTGEHSETCGFFPVFQKNAGRQSAANYLQPFLSSDRLRIQTRSEVRRVLIRDGRAVGVEIGDQTRHRQIHARQGIVVCAGALLTPGILQCSGIGPAHVLSAAGLHVEVDAPEVGKNLQDHVRAPVVFRSSAPSPGRKSRWVSAALRYLLRGDGVMTSNCCEVGCFLGQPEASPDVEIITLFQTSRHPHAVEIMAVLMHPRSRGTVQIDPRNPFGPPLIDPQYLADPADAEELMAAIRRIRMIASQPALHRFGISNEILPGCTDLRTFLRAEASTCHHPVGTCRMGHDERSVVDPRLKVRGIENLWIADCSVVPEIPAAHTAATALMIGERAAELLATDLEHC